MSELRRTPRWEIRTTIKVAVEDSLNYKLCFLEDISFKGARISFQYPLSMKRFIPMSLIFKENEESVNVLADIRWSQQYAGKHTYGVFFQRMDSKCRIQLQELLNQCFLDQWHYRWEKSTQNTFNNE